MEVPFSGFIHNMSQAYMLIQVDEFDYLKKDFQ